MVDLINPEGKKVSFILITWAHQYDKETNEYSYQFDTCENREEKLKNKSDL